MSTPEQDRPDRLAEIKQRTEKATPGPWWAWDRGVGFEIALGSPDDLDEYNRPAQYLPDGDRTSIGRREDAEFIAHSRSDVEWLVAEVERLGQVTAVARRLLDNLQLLADDHADPGTEALGAIYEGRQLLIGRTAPPDDLVTRAAEAIAETIGHEREDDTPEGPCCDGTIPCAHEPEPGCGACASFGWPCDVALDAARAAFKAISPFPDALALPAKDGAR